MVQLEVQNQNLEKNIIPYCIDTGSKVMYDLFILNF